MAPPQGPGLRRADWHNTDPENPFGAGTSFLDPFGVGGVLGVGSIFSADSGLYATRDFNPGAALNYALFGAMGTTPTPAGADSPAAWASNPSGAVVLWRERTVSIPKGAYPVNLASLPNAKYFVYLDSNNQVSTTPTDHGVYLDATGQPIAQRSAPQSGAFSVSVPSLPNATSGAYVTATGAISATRTSQMRYWDANGNVVGSASRSGDTFVFYDAHKEPVEFDFNSPLPAIIREVEQYRRENTFAGPGQVLDTPVAEVDPEVAVRAEATAIPPLQASCLFRRRLCLCLRPLHHRSRSCTPHPG